MRTKLIILSTVLVAILIHQFQFEVVKINIGPIVVNAPIDSVFACFKNQFTNPNLWKMFDYNNTTVSVEINRVESNSTYVSFVIIKQHKVVSFLDYKINVVLDGFSIINENEEDKIISSTARSRDGLVISEPRVIIKDMKTHVVINENIIVHVPRLFMRHTYDTAYEEHLEVLNKIKTEVELDNDLCK
jgi:hypothetical protein